VHRNLCWHSVLPVGVMKRGGRTSPPTTPEPQGRIAPTLAGAVRALLRTSGSSVDFRAATTSTWSPGTAKC